MSFYNLFVPLANEQYLSKYCCKNLLAVLMVKKQASALKEQTI
jgi:hypothetical protein